MKRLLAALLPSESREHVLGDLQQRGNRTRDILSVLPRVWFSHFLRAFFGPFPSLAGASAATLRRRSSQLDRRGFYGSTAFTAVNLASDYYQYIHGAGSKGLLWFLSIAWLGNVFLKVFVRIWGVYRPNPDRDWVAGYRVSLQFAAADCALMPLLIALTYFYLPLRWLPRWGLVAAIAASPLVIGAAFVVGRRNSRRLLAELAYLDDQPEPLA